MMAAQNETTTTIPVINKIVNFKADSIIIRIAKINNIRIGNISNHKIVIATNHTHNKTQTDRITINSIKMREEVDSIATNNKIVVVAAVLVVLVVVVIAVAAIGANHIADLEI